MCIVRWKKLISILEDECTITAYSVGKKIFLKSDERAHKNNTTATTATATTTAAAADLQNRTEQNKRDEKRI